MPDFVIYIDDSGTKEYDVNRTYDVAGNSRYFVFGGVLISTVESGNLATAIRALKKATFGTDKVEIKSNWLRIPKEREKRYLKGFDLTEAQLTEFVDAYYSTISQINLQLIAVVVDKVHVQQMYPAPYYAPAIAYEVLMQRVVLQCKEPNSVSVVIDDMTGATPKGNQYKANLQMHHRALRKRGSFLQPKIDFSPLGEGIKFVDSAISNQVQVADIISYNILRQFRDHGEEWENASLNSINLPTYEWFARLAPKFRQGPGKRIQGYGVVKFPMLNRLKWSLVEKGD